MTNSKMLPSIRRALISLVGVAVLLGECELARGQVCASDTNSDGVVTVDELLKGVNAMLYGCPQPTRGSATGRWEGSISLFDGTRVPLRMSLVESDGVTTGVWTLESPCLGSGLVFAASRLSWAPEAVNGAASNEDVILSVTMDPGESFMGGAIRVISGRATCIGLGGEVTVLRAGAP